MDKILEGGPTWHGALIGWHESIARFITKIPIISERFSGVKYSEGQNTYSLHTNTWKR